jgi:hypothetical protein
MEKRKCKTCGRTVGQYGYGGNSWYRTFDQRVGKISKDKWLQATSRFNSEYDENDKKVRWTFGPNQNAQSLFCRQMCVDAYLEQFNETIDRLPNLVSV